MSPPMPFTSAKVGMSSKCRYVFGNPGRAALVSTGQSDIAHIGGDIAWGLTDVSGDIGTPLPTSVVTSVEGRAMSAPIGLGAENIAAYIGLSHADIGADMRGADFTSV